MPYTFAQPDTPVTGTPVSSADFGIKVANSIGALKEQADALALDVAAIAGGLHAMGIVSAKPDQLITGALTDITGMTVTLTLTETCTILLLASNTLYCDTTTVGFTCYVVGSINGVADATHPEYQANGSHNPQRNEGLMYIHAKTGVPAGSRIVKLRAQNSGSNVYYTSGRLIALAFKE